jgi:hypothetical protein
MSSRLLGNPWKIAEFIMQLEESNVLPFIPPFSPDIFASQAAS